MLKRLAIVLLLSAPGWGQQILTQIAQSTPPISLVAPTLVQKVGCGGVSGSITCTIASTASGDSLLVEGSGNNSNCTSATASGATFLMWQNVSLGGTNDKSILFARNVSSGITTITLNCTGTNSGAVVYEWSAPAGEQVAIDAIGSATGTGGTPSVTTIEPVNSSAEAVVASIYDNANFRTLTAGTGYTMQQRVNNSSHASNCTTTCLIGSATQNTTTGLTGTQTGSITGISTDNWNMAITGLAVTSTQDVADTYITFEGLSNTVSPTVAQLKASTFGVPGTWAQPTSANFTGATGSQGTTTPAAHQVGASSLTGSGSLGLAYATGTVNKDLTWTPPLPTTNFSWIGQFKTSLPQNDTNLNAYTLTQINENAAADYLAPQIQANGSALHMLPECESLTGSGSVAIATNTLYYFAVTTAPGAVQGVSVASFAGTSGTLTFTNSATNTFTSGQSIGLSGFSAPNTGLNGQTVTVLSAGLTSTTFEAAVTGSGYSSGAGKAAGFHTITVYDSTGAQVGSTTTCLAEPQTVSWTLLTFGVNGNEAESSGSVISFDNVRISLTGKTLTP